MSSIIYLTENKLTSLRLRSTDDLSFVLCSKVKIVKIEICVTCSIAFKKVRVESFKIDREYII